MSVQIIDTLTEIADNPVEGAVETACRAPMETGLVCYAAGALGFFAAAGIWNLIPSGFFFLMPVFIFQTFWGFLAAATAHLFLESTGGEQGKAAGLFVLFGVSDLVLTLMVPAALLTAAFAGSSAALSAFTTVFCLHFCARIFAVRCVYGCGAFRAFTAVLLPYAALAAGTGLVLLSGLAWLVSLLLT
ncbi:MAG: hypothetical protein ABIG11_02965 [bacterium]